MANSDQTNEIPGEENIPWNFIERIAKEGDAKTVVEIHRLAVEYGRAISLSTLAAFVESGSRTEDEAIRAADKAWVEFADNLMLFFVGKGIGHAEGN